VLSQQHARTVYAPDGPFRSGRCRVIGKKKTRRREGALSEHLLVALMKEESPPVVAARAELAEREALLADTPFENAQARIDAVTKRNAARQNLDKALEGALSNDSATIALRAEVTDAEKELSRLEAQAPIPTDPVPSPVYQPTATPTMSSPPQRRIPRHRNPNTIPAFRSYAACGEPATMFASLSAAR